METTRENSGETDTNGRRRPSGEVVRRSQGKRGQTAASTIYQSLRADIVAMRLKPGAPVVEKTIAQAFGVSRTPVREAVLRLADERLIDIFPQSGTFVAPIPIETLPEAQVIRESLENTAVKLAAEKATAEDVERLKDNLAVQREAAAAGDQEAFHQADEDFHALISEIAGFPGIWKMVSQVKVQIDRFRRLTLPVPGRMAMVVGEHAAIVAAIAENDPAAAESGLSAHLSYLGGGLDKTRTDNPAYFTGSLEDGEG